MIRFALQRVFYLVVVLLVLSLITYVLFFAGAPANLAAEVAGHNASAAAIHDTMLRLGLEHSFWYQYWHYLRGIALHFNFGTDFQNQEPVITEIRQRLPTTASLAVGGAVVWLAIGIPIGIQSATKPGSVRDRMATVFALTFLSLPSFVLGLTLLLFLSFDLTLHAHLHWFPAGGYTPFTASPLQWFVHLVLPWITLALVSAAVYTRLIRGSLLDVLGEDYIRTARAKGLSRRTVLYRHGVRAALTPVVTQLGLDVGTLLGGAIVIENVFSLQGVGQLALQSLFTENLPVVSATVLLGAAFIVIANTVVDIVYAGLDPRVRLI
jgi:peptide/nickel transport system permease protein